MSNTTPPPIVLSPISVDYYSIYSALEASLIAGKSWTNLAKSGQGATILRWVSSVGALAQGSVARSLQENFPDTARSPSAILRCARLQGIRIIRARPGTLTISVTRTDSSADVLNVPAYSSWVVGDQPFFNRYAFSMPADGSAVEIVLYRGTIAYESFTGDGTTFQKFVIGQRGVWDISADDVWMVDSLGITWTPIYTGLWREKPDSTSFEEKTLPDGRVECKFGDGNYGGILPPGDLTFGYVVLESAINTSSPPLIGSQAAAKNFPVIGTVANIASANQDAPSPEFYKMMGPGAAANNARAVTRDDHRAIALAYDGVIDAIFQGQAEINPSDIRWMNIISVTLLTTTPWTDLQWMQFRRYMESQRGIASTTFVRKDPTPVHINIPVKIRALQIADLNSVTSLANSVIQDFFARKTGALGASYTPSDLIVKIMENATYQQAPNETGPLLDTIEVPPDSIQLPPTSYFVLDSAPLDVGYTTRKSSAASLDLIVGDPIIRRN